MLRGKSGRATSAPYEPDLTEPDTHYGCNLRVVAPRVNTEDLIDANGVAEIVGLAHRNTVSVYQRRYAEMPHPVVDLGPAAYEAVASP